MAECIEREALIEKLRTMPIPKQAGRANTWLDNCAAGVNAAIWEVASFPAADVAPVVHAQWIENGSGIIICPECKRGYNLIAKYTHYCPSCGAKMDGGNADESRDPEN